MQTLRCEWCLKDCTEIVHIYGLSDRQIKRKGQVIRGDCTRCWDCIKYWPYEGLLVRAWDKGTIIGLYGTVVILEESAPLQSACNS